MTGAPRKPPSFRVLAGESRREGRHWESLRAAVRRSALTPIAGDARADPANAVDVSVRARFTVEGIRALHARSEAWRGAKPGAADDAFAEALVAIGAPSAEGRARGEALERILLAEGQPLGRARLTWDVKGPELSMEVRFASEAVSRAIQNGTLRVRFDGGPTLTAAHGATGARFAAGAALVGERSIRSVELAFEPLGSLILRPDDVKRAR